MRTLRSFVILALVIGMLAFGAAGLFAAATEESGSAMAKEMITDPTSGAQFTAPTYGGTLTLATHGGYTFAVDSFENGRSYRAINGVVEKLAMMDWGWTATCTASTPTTSRCSTCAVCWPRVGRPPTPSPP